MVDSDSRGLDAAEKCRSRLNVIVFEGNAFVLQLGRRRSSLWGRSDVRDCKDAEKKGSPFSRGRYSFMLMKQR